MAPQCQRPGQKKQTPLALNLALNLNLKPKWELFGNSRSLEEEALHIAYALHVKGKNRPCLGLVAGSFWPPRISYRPETMEPS